jgi:hypothetical protein
MKAFTIQNETNNIIVHAAAKDAEAVENAVSFRNEWGVTKLETHGRWHARSRFGTACPE